jgi:mannosyltransferase PIG-V
MRRMSTTAPSAARPASEPLPRWASLLDLLTVILLIATLVLLAFGGVRFRVAGLRVSIMSAWRPFLAAAIVAAIRHVIVRRDPLYARVVAWIRTTRNSEAFAASWPVFIATRLAVLIIGYFAVVTIGYPETVPPFRVYENELRNLPARWDTGWYLAIATGGYRWAADVTGQQNIAFFPAYPILMRIAGRILRDETLWAGVAISLAAFFAALVYFYRLARDWLDAPGATAATTLLAAYPFALFFSAAYTESLFLLAAVGAFYHLRRDQFLAAGLWGVLAGLTRPNGCLLAIPLVLVVLEKRRRESASGFAADRRLLTALAAAAMPAVGMAIFSAFLLRLTGNPLEWARNHAAWGRTFRGVHRIVLDRYDFITEYGLYEYTVSLPVDVLNGIAAVFALVMTWPVWKRLGLSFATFVLVNLVPPLAMGGLLSIGRVTSVLFPVFICLAQVVKPERRAVVTMGFAMLQAFFAALFFTWRPLY